METTKIEYQEGLILSLIEFFKSIADDCKDAVRNIDVWQWATTSFAPDAQGRSLFSLEIGYRLMAVGDDNDDWAIMCKPCAAIIACNGKDALNAEFKAAMTSMFGGVVEGSFSFIVNPSDSDIYDAYMVPLEVATALYERRQDKEAQE